MPREHDIEESWDIKRIAFGSLVSAILVAGILYVTHIVTFDNNLVSFHSPFPAPTPIGQVAGANTDLGNSADSFSPNTLRQTAQQKLDEIKQELQNLQASDLATSSPQVQKVITDLKSLEQYPQTQVKNTCIQVCNSL